MPARAALFAHFQRTSFSVETLRRSGHFSQRRLNGGIRVGLVMSGICSPPGRVWKLFYGRLLQRIVPYLEVPSTPQAFTQQSPTFSLSPKSGRIHKQLS